MATPRPPSTRPRRWASWLGTAALVLGLGLLAWWGVAAWQRHQFDQRVASGQIQVPSLRGWMTLPYIARLYGVPESSLRQALQAPASGGDDRSLRGWFRELDIDPEQGRARIERVILAESPTREVPLERDQ